MSIDEGLAKAVRLLDQVLLKERPGEMVVGVSLPS